MESLTESHHALSPPDVAGAMLGVVGRDEPFVVFDDVDVGHLVAELSPLVRERDMQALWIYGPDLTDRIMAVFGFVEELDAERRANSSLIYRRAYPRLEPSSWAR